MLVSQREDDYSTIFVRRGRSGALSIGMGLSKCGGGARKSVGGDAFSLLVSLFGRLAASVHSYPSRSSRYFYKLGVSRDLMQELPTIVQSGPPHASCGAAVQHHSQKHHTAGLLANAEVIITSHVTMIPLSLLSTSAVLGVLYIPAPLARFF
jgi:hypothetical protein